MTERQNILEQPISYKKHQSLWTINFILICLSTLTCYISFHSLLPTLPIYIQKSGGSKSSAGLALAFLTIAAVIIRPITGWALDNLGRRFILILGLITFLIPSLFYISLVPVSLLLVLRLIQGFGWGISNTSQGTVATDLIPIDRLGEGLGFFGLTTSISLAAGPAIGLWLINHFSFRILFITSSTLTIISLIFTLIIKFPKTIKPTTKIKLVFMEKLALGPAFIILLVTINYSSLLSFLALFLQTKNLNAGLFFMTLAVATLVSRPFSGKIIDKYKAQGYNFIILPGLLAIIISIFIIPQINSSFDIILAGCFYGIGFGFIQPTMLTLCIARVPDTRRGGANATYWTAFDIGVALGSVLWGIAANSVGYKDMFYLNILPLLAALFIYLIKRDTLVKTSTNY